jgi:hypothetical protein
MFFIVSHFVERITALLRYLKLVLQNDLSDNILSACRAQLQSGENSVLEYSQKAATPAV